MRRAHCAADDEVGNRLQGLHVDLACPGLRVDRVASDEDRRLRRLLSPAWHAVQRPELWDFHLLTMAQERLFAATKGPLGCLRLSDLHHLLKVMR
jgi:hypothetical protein